MKKVLFILIIFCILTSNSYASGEICGEVLNTDIRAYIDSMPVRSYNIDGWTGVLAEDLREYGFYVEWNENERSLYISKEMDGVVTASYQFEENTKPTGSHAAYVYSTDIKTYVDGNIVKAFNIGGYTLIYIDELQVYGDVVWNAEKREISYTYRSPWSINLTPENTNAARHEGGGPYTDGITGFSGTFAKNETGDFEVSGENLDHISWINLEYNKRYGGLRLGFSFIAHHLLADYEFTQLCWDMSTIRYDGERLADNADKANNHTKIYVNGNPVKITEVMQGKGNNHEDFYFVLDLDINKEDINEIMVKCGL